EPRRRAVEHRCLERRAGVGRDEEAERARPIELAVPHTRAGCAPPVRCELWAEVLQVVESVEQDPRTEALLLAHQRARLRNAPPHRGAPILLCPHRHDPRRGIPAPQPLLLIARRCWAPRRTWLHEKWIADRADRADPADRLKARDSSLSA